MLILIFDNVFIGFIDIFRNHTRTLYEVICEGSCQSGFILGGLSAAEICNVWVKQWKGFWSKDMFALEMLVKTL